MALFTLIQGEEVKKIESIWNNIEAYWKKYDNKMVTSEGDSKKEIIKFENKHHISLPKEMIYSLTRNFQNSRHGRDGLKYPWFGSNVGIDLLSIDEIKEAYEFYGKYSGLKNTKLSHIKTIFIGNFSYDNVTKWHDKWIPIVWNDDLPIIIFLDMDEKSKNYQKIIGLDDIYLEDVGDHFRFVLIADNYLEFLSDLKETFFEYQAQTNNEMESSGEGKGFEFYYYEKKFKYPKGFWTNEYRAEQIKKLGL